MSNKNIYIISPNNIIMDKYRLDMYYSPIIVKNIKSILASNQVTLSSGNIGISTSLPIGIELFNSKYGHTGIYNLTSSGSSYFINMNNIDLFKFNIQVSGSNFIR